MLLARTLLCVGAAVAWLSEGAVRAPRVKFAVTNPLTCDTTIASLRDQAMTLTSKAESLRIEARSLESELAVARASKNVVTPAVKRRRLSREHVEACLHGLSSHDLLRFDTMAGRFVASVGLAQPDGAVSPCERVTFVPSFGGGAGLRRRSVMYTLEKKPPLGLLLEENADGRVVVAAVDGVGDYARATASVRRGDVLRACSAADSFGAQARVLMRCESLPFDEVLSAVHSNRETPNTPALLVLERPLFSEDVEPPTSCSVSRR